MHSFKTLFKNYDTYETLVQKTFYWEFPGGPMVRTQCVHEARIAVGLVVHQL